MLLPEITDRVARRRYYFLRDFHLTEKLKIFCTTLSRSSGVRKKLRNAFLGIGWDSRGLCEHFCATLEPEISFLDKVRTVATHHIKTRLFDENHSEKCRKVPKRAEIVDFRARHQIPCCFQRRSPNFEHFFVNFRKIAVELSMLLWERDPCYWTTLHYFMAQQTRFSRHVD